MLLCAVVIGIIGMHGLAWHASTAGSSHGVHVTVMDLSGHHDGALASDTAQPVLAAPEPEDHSEVMALCVAMLTGAAFAVLLLLPRRRSPVWFVQSASSPHVFSVPLTLFQRLPVSRFSVIRC